MQRIQEEVALFFIRRPGGIKKARWSVVMNNAHICSGHPISNCDPSPSHLLYLLTLVLTLKTISTPSLLSHPISLHIKLWSSEWPIVACCCCDIFGYIKFFFVYIYRTLNIHSRLRLRRINTKLSPLFYTIFFDFFFFLT